MNVILISALCLAVPLVLAAVYRFFWTLCIAASGADEMAGLE